MEPVTTMTTKATYVTVFALFGLITVNTLDATAMFLGLMGATTRLFWQSPTSWKAALLGTFLGIMLSWNFGLAILEYFKWDIVSYESRFVLFTIGYGANAIASKLDGAIDKMIDKPIELIASLFGGKAP